MRALSRMYVGARYEAAVSVYGLGRFPVTPYYAQRSRLLDREDALRALFENHESKLKLRSRSEE